MARKVKSTMVELEVASTKERREMCLEQAERLLSMGEANGGWQLPTDSKYYYDSENGLRLKSNKGNITESEEENHDSEGY